MIVKAQKRESHITSSDIKPSLPSVSAVVASGKCRKATRNPPLPNLRLSVADELIKE